MLTKTELKAGRGWTDSLIRDFLPEPDDRAENPHYKCAPPMLLYRKERVQAVEQSEGFQARMAASAKRKAGAKKAVETKRQRLQQHVQAIQIKVPRVAREELLRRACEDYNACHLGSEKFASPYSDPEFLERIMVNYLRHCLTPYESILGEMSGKVGFTDGYVEVREKVLDAISETYPWLAAECFRQTTRFFETASLSGW